MAINPIANSAAEQVFGTTELVELILTNLSLRDLLAAQRACFLFSEVVKRHSEIRKTRYLLPDHSLSLKITGYANTNPLYLQRFVQQACLFALQQPNLNVDFLGMDRFVRKREKSFAEPSANWRQMLLFQPPVKLALLKSMSSHFEDTYSYIGNIDGLTMGDVVEFFVKKAQGGEKSIDLLAATITRKVVWSVMPASGTEDEYIEPF
jgi:hypothetical protein